MFKNIKQLVKNKSYWSNEQIDSIKDGYIDLIKDEFFKITQKYFPTKMPLIIYEENEEIINSQANEFTEKINEIFQRVTEQQRICETIQEIDLEKGTNYTIRETENEREVKARIESNGKLEDLIEQDF